MAALPPRVFLLSPARAGGERMGLLLNPRAGFALAWEFQQKGAALGEVFSVYDEIAPVELPED